jgi:hypothetical protein
MKPALLMILAMSVLVAAGPARAKKARQRAKPSVLDGAELRERALPAAQPPRVTSEKPATPPVDEKALAAVVQENRTSIKLCYQRVLKREPTLKVAKVVTTLAIERSGRVAKITFDEPGEASDMGECLAQAIKGWDFPASATAYAFRFPIVLAAD